ncbi:MAG: YdjY domain-containing protein [candidate division KSB1 bacterium]|nr:YdjY domain-containing protein [candidate division KSB1 bacterium]MDZ7367746.1 YdjY domain-containing protein [candidate division KSB1 bacterium]MDZ7406289.1 YdjY domain-containing protein [candidate division KSB1 bacterium]
MFWSLLICFSAVITPIQKNALIMPNASTPMIVDSVRQEVRVLATYHPGKFSGFLRFVPNYHLLVWDDGRAARESLFSTPVPDTTLIAAFEKLGATAGNNLTMEAWDKRNDSKHPAPQTRIAGTPVEILVWWKGLPQPQPLAELLDDPGGRGLDFRFGGNKDLIKHWHSGCLVCLYSCPGSKVGNAAYTVRDYATGATKFTPRQDRMPKSNSEVAIIFRLRNGEGR